MSKWKFAGSSADGESFVIEGVDVWKHQWIRVGGERAIVKDPLYGQTFRFDVYEVGEQGARVRFAAGEFSNCVWGFYTPAPSSPRSSLWTMLKRVVKSGTD